MKQDDIIGKYSNLTERGAQDMPGAQAVEGPHWAPPEAPLAMPRQVLERETQRDSHGLLARFFSPQHTA